MCWWPWKKQASVQQTDSNTFQMQQLLCPRDGAPMRKIIKQDVIIDKCPRCKGIWLDNQELEKLFYLGKQHQPGGKNRAQEPDAKQKKGEYHGKKPK
ncbi:MAG: zf-TFIIB domain-containing protein [Candidatus Woesearchaeota archaeon]